MSPPNVEPGLTQRGPARSLSQSIKNTQTRSTCIFCHERPAVWVSPTGHAACLACRLDDLYPIIANTLTMVTDLRDRLLEIGELVTRERG